MKRRRSDARQAIITIAVLAALTVVGLWAGWRYNEAVYGDGRRDMVRCRQ